MPHSGRKNADPVLLMALAFGVTTLFSFGVFPSSVGVCNRCATTQRSEPRPC